MSKQIDLPTKMRMAFYYGQNDSQRLIAEKTGTSKTSVNRYLQLLDKSNVQQKIVPKARKYARYYPITF